MSKRSVKVTFGEELRRFEHDLNNFKNLKKAVLARFGLVEGKWQIKWKDSDGDLVMLQCDQDLQDALDSPACPAVLRLSIVPQSNWQPDACTAGKLIALGWRPPVSTRKTQSNININKSDINMFIKMHPTLKERRAHLYKHEAHHQLMQEIKGCANTRRAAVGPPPPVSRTDLLQEIKAGKALRPVPFSTGAKRKAVYHTTLPQPRANLLRDIRNHSRCSNTRASGGDTGPRRKALLREIRGSGRHALKKASARDCGGHSPVEQVMAMGFRERELVEDVLAACGNDVLQAVSTLLMFQSPNACRRAPQSRGYADTNSTGGMTTWRKKRLAERVDELARLASLRLVSLADWMLLDTLDCMVQKWYMSGLPTPDYGSFDCRQQQNATYFDRMKWEMLEEDLNEDGFF